MTWWRPDVLGEGWEQLTIDLPPNAEGPVVATLVRRSPVAEPDERPAVLHVHGYNDYFFQTHVGEHLEAHGYAFYALDLRTYGRSWRPWQTPGYCTDLAEHIPELHAAARLIAEAGHPRLVVMAHSTGGLVASLWAHSLRKAGVVDALVLNSPWFDLNAPWLSRVVWTRVLDAVGPVDPRRSVGGGPSYSRTLHVGAGGEWEYDLALKRPEGVPARAGWLRAVRRGQARLARGLAVAAPVLVCVAQESGPDDDANPERHRQDTVLDVRQILERAPLLGEDVTVVAVPDGIHDLSLSAAPARQAYLEAVTGWLDERLGRASRGSPPGHSS